jgi:Ca-activated chloride channel family protein
MYCALTPMTFIRLLATTTLSYAGPSAACDLALAFAVDVSGSVDTIEYGIQVDGLADGLRDGAVAAGLVRSNAALMFVQWTGSSRQIVTVPWTQITSFEDVEAFAVLVENSERQWRNYSTAIGEALMFTSAAFQSAPTCTNNVIDVSGDGISNEGIEPDTVQNILRTAKIRVNALAIEGSEDDLTAYFWENVIYGEGAFVVTANGFKEYGEKIRLKLRRETTAQISDLTNEHDLSTRFADLTPRSGPSN